MEHMEIIPLCTPTTPHPYYPLPPPTPTTPYHHPPLLEMMVLKEANSYTIYMVLKEVNDLVSDW